MNGSISRRSSSTWSTRDQVFRPEHLGQIFSPFFTTREKGTGLGLAIASSDCHDARGPDRGAADLRRAARVSASGCRSARRLNRPRSSRHAGAAYDRPSNGAARGRRSELSQGRGIPAPGGWLSSAHRAQRGVRVAAISGRTGRRRLDRCQDAGRRRDGAARSAEESCSRISRSSC